MTTSRVRARLAARGAAVAAGVALGAVWVAPPAWAHDSIEDAFARGAGPPGWILLATAWVALLGLLGIVVVAAFQHWWPSLRPWPRYWAVTAWLLALWVLLGSWQAWTARTSGTPAVLLDAGYLVLPLALGAVWVFVLANYRATLRRVLGRWRYRWLALVLTAGFVALLLWAGNVVDVPDADDLPPPGSPAFWQPFSAYGPLAIWPNVEFWLPSVQVFGAISVGVAMVVLTLAALMGLTWTGLVVAVATRARAGRRPGASGIWAVLGTFGANVCCCCAPAIYPLLAAVLGTSAASSVSVWLVGSSSPLYNVAYVGMIAIILVALRATHKRLTTGPSPDAPVLPDARSTDAEGARC